MTYVRLKNYNGEVTPDWHDSIVSLSRIPVVGEVVKSDGFDKYYTVKHVVHFPMKHDQSLSAEIYLEG